eukprot:g28945.t1
MKKEDLRQLPAGTTPCPFPRRELQASKDQVKEPKALSKETQRAALTGKGCSPGRVSFGGVEETRLCHMASESVVWLGNANADFFPSAKKARTETEPERRDEATASPTAQSPVSREEEDEEEETQEDIATKQQAQDMHPKPPKKGIVRYTFRDEGLLGIRLSRDVPPWILEVRDGTLAARKAPKVPVGGVVTAINGYDLSVKENPRALRALARRPVVLDIDWPMDSISWSGVQVTGVRLRVEEKEEELSEEIPDEFDSPQANVLQLLPIETLQDADLP